MFVPVIFDKTVGLGRLPSIVSMQRTSLSISNVGYNKNNHEHLPIGNPTLGSMQPLEMSNYLAVGTSTIATIEPVPPGDSMASDLRKTEDGERQVCRYFGKDSMSILAHDV